MDELLEALHALIDARLIEHGLLEEDKPAKGGKKKPAGKKAAAEDEEVTIDSLKDKLTQVVNDVGKDEAKALLKKFRAAKLSDLPEAKYEKFNAALDEALGAGGSDDASDLFGE